jgi:hypothetical protein
MDRDEYALMNAAADQNVNLGQNADDAKSD